MMYFLSSLWMSSVFSLFQNLMLPPLQILNTSYLFVSELDYQVYFYLFIYLFTYFLFSFNAFSQ